MYTPAYQEIKKAIEKFQYGYRQSRTIRYRVSNPQWDRIICRVCSGCGISLGDYENKNRWAFCRDCRRILFPETTF